MGRLLTCLLLILFQLSLTPCLAQGGTIVTKEGVRVNVEFFTPRTVHITKVPDGSAMQHRSLVVTAKPDATLAVKRTETATAMTVSSRELKVRVDKRSGLVTFTVGSVTVGEKSTAFEARTAGPDAGAYRVSTTFQLQRDEPIYGLGTLQDGRLSHRGKKVEMEQSNLEDFQNVFQSVRGWGLFWDNYSRTTFDSPEGGTTMTLSSEVGDGVDYYFMASPCLTMNKKDVGPVTGVIAEMRTLSGQVPMFPLWTYGYWQSKERYKSAAETEAVVDKYRELQVPLDGIIQDWQYWGSNYLWNAMEFNAEEFKDGQRMIDEVHRRHAHFMISIWASFGPMTKQYRELDSLGLLYDFGTWPRSGLGFWPPRMDYPSGVRVYDAFSPVARDIYWRYLRQLFDAGTDAWWMDSTDPDNFDMQESDYDHPAGDGTYRRYRNAFPLATVAGVYDHQRGITNSSSPQLPVSSIPQLPTSSEKRVFIMTRSAFAGQQRYGAGLWSGDVESSWTVLRRQVPLGLNYTMTGCPNFNTDIGGFFAGRYNTKGGGSAPRNPQYQELYVRWMQYGLFCPVFRSHGTDCAREVWQFGQAGEPVFDAIVSQLRLRYRLLPYLYSTAWLVTSANDSYMRPLVDDFVADRRTWEEGQEFMFGRSILAAPILEAQYTPEEIDKKRDFSDVDFRATKTATKYLPKGTAWYDFWTGTRYSGGRDVTIETRLDRVPMFVRAGSIVPLGPEMQWVGEKSWEELELRVYPGADASFLLYEDEGDNYNYERGQYATIGMTWDDRQHTLTIGKRQGNYPGMLQQRRFVVVLPDGVRQTVNYDGGEVQVKM